MRGLPCLRSPREASADHWPAAVRKSTSGIGARVSRASPDDDADEDEEELEAADPAGEASPPLLSSPEPAPAAGPARPAIATSLGAAPANRSATAIILSTCWSSAGTPPCASARTPAQASSPAALSSPSPSMAPAAPSARLAASSCCFRRFRRLVCMRYSCCAS